MLTFTKNLKRQHGVLVGMTYDDDVTFPDTDVTRSNCSRHRIHLSYKHAIYEAITVHRWV